MYLNPVPVEPDGIISMSESVYFSVILASLWVSWKSTELLLSSNLNNMMGSEGESGSSLVGGNSSFQH